MEKSFHGDSRARLAEERIERKLSSCPRRGSLETRSSEIGDRNIIKKLLFFNFRAKLFY